MTCIEGAKILGRD